MQEVPILCEGTGGLSPIGGHIPPNSQGVNFFGFLRLCKNQYLIKAQ